MKVMKSLFVLAAAAVLALAGGCRREDVRTFDMEVDSLSASNAPAITAALSKYGGVRKETVAFDYEKKTVSLEYDSMQVAKANLRMAIEAAVSK